MASRKYSSKRKKSDLRLGILSPRQTPTLLTSVSQVMTPTRLTSIYTTNNSSHSEAINVPLQQMSLTKHDIDSTYVQGQITKSRPTKQETVLETEHMDIKPEVQVMAEGKMYREDEGLKESHIEVTSLPPLDSELFIQNIESQIIPNHDELDKATFNDDTDFNDLFPISVSEEQKAEVEYSHKISSDQERYITRRIMGNIDSEIFIPQQGIRSHTSSICSNSLGSEYGSLSTRCSVCDSCNSALLSTHPLSSNSYMFNYRTGSGSRQENRINKKDFCDPRYHSDREKGFSDAGTYCNSTDLIDRRTLSESGYTSEGRTELPSGPRPYYIDQVNPAQTNNIETLKQKKVLSDFERRLESMILMVLLLSKQMKKSMTKLETVQLHLTQLQDRQVYYDKRLRRLYLGFICLLLLYIVQVTSFRKQLYSLVRFFGIFEVFERVNRTRKVVAKNWRNIPSLLTDFWRIFIFRSRSRLQERFS